MKKVLVPLAEYTIPGQHVAMHFARETYINKLVSVGLTPVFVSSLFPDAMVDVLYDECGGVLCMGGSDIDPSHYGKKTEEKTVVSEPRRDNLELRIIKKALHDRKPYLGICRGHQALAIASGGDLIQHLDADKESHSATTYDDLLTKPGHDIIIESSSRAYKIIGKHAIHVNTAHHQAVRTPGNDLDVAGRSPEGIIELLEHTDPTYFCFSLQCHPEAMNGDTDVLFLTFSKHVRTT